MNGVENLSARIPRSIGDFRGPYF